MRVSVLLSVIAAGCGTNLSVMNQARVLGAGKAEAGIAASVSRQPTEFFLESVQPSVEVYGRTSFSDMMDGGIKLFPAGLLADINVMVWSNKEMALSLDPTLGGGIYSLGDSPSGYGALWVPVLFDYNVKPDMILTVGGRMGALLFYGPEVGAGGGDGLFQPEPSVLYGFNASFRFPAGPTELVPHLDVLLGGEETVWNLALGASFDL